MKLLFVTSNKNKAQEVGSMLGVDMAMGKMDIPEIQSLSAVENATHKAHEAYKVIKKPLIVEDTGLYIKGFGGFPGALVKWYEKGFGYEGICRSVDMCKDRSAYAETCIAFYDGKKMRTFVGRVNGKISRHPQGRGGFGWDCIFVPDGYTKAFSKMRLDEKMRISHRGNAVRKLKAFLKTA